MQSLFSTKVDLRQECKLTHVLLSLQSLLDFPPILTNLAPASQPQAAPASSFPTFPISSSSSFPQVTSSGVTSTTVPQIPGVPILQQQPFVLPPPPSAQNPVLTGFGGAGQIRQPTPVFSAASQQPSIPNNATPTTATSLDLLGDLNLNLNLGPQQPPAVGGGQISGGASQSWGAFQSDPLAVLTDLTVPKEKIEPSKLT